MTNKKPLVLYNGVYRQIADEDNILDKYSNSIAKRAESIAKKNINIDINTKNNLIIQIFKNGTNLSSGQFYDYFRAGNHTRSSGSWNGWTNSNPIIIPFNCMLKKVFVNFSQAQFDWRSIAGNLYLDIGFIDHNHNSTFNERIMRLELIGDFVNNNTGTEGFRYNVSNISLMLGNNYFQEGEIIGFLLRTSNSVPGRIFQISNPYHSLIFEEV